MEGTKEGRWRPDRDGGGWKKSEGRRRYARDGCDRMKDGGGLRRTKEVEEGWEAEYLLTQAGESRKRYERTNGDIDIIWRHWSEVGGIKKN